MYVYVHYYFDAADRDRHIKRGVYYNLGRWSYAQQNHMFSTDFEAFKGHLSFEIMGIIHCSNQQICLERLAIIRLVRIMSHNHTFSTYSIHSF